MSEEIMNINAVNTASPNENQEKNDYLVIKGELENLKKLISWRFDALSTEIKTASQRIGMAEDDTKELFVDILEALNAFSNQSSSTEQTTAGRDLQKIVEISEKAASEIMDATRHIAAKIHDAEQEENSGKRSKILNDVGRDLQAIQMACTFQDLTGQRISELMEQFKHVEHRVEQTIKQLGISIDPQSEKTEN